MSIANGFRFILPKHKGAVAVEFAFMIGILLLISAGIFEFGRAYWHYNALSKATRDAARLLSMTPRDQLSSGSVEAKNLVINAAAASNICTIENCESVMQIETLCNEVACSDGMALTTQHYVRVEVSYPLTIGGIFPFILPLGGAVSSYSTTLNPYSEMLFMNERS
jgi:Flp pilus assembly protein TadG